MFKNYIGGQLVEGKDSNLVITNPGNEDAVANILMINKAQAQEALEAAQIGFKYWSNLSLSEREIWIRKLRQEILNEKDAIINLLMQETGKLYDLAVGDFQMLPDCLDFFIEEAKRLHGEVINDISGDHENIIIRQPLGVVVGYLAWNFPLLNLGYKLGPVLASGCSCIIKPSSLTPLSTLLIGHIAERIGFPSGVINIVVGRTEEIAEVFNKSRITKLITLIGSSETGRTVISNSCNSIKHYSLELGGNAPAIVLNDFEVNKAAEILTNFKFANCGQVCVSPNRVFVHEDQYENFLFEASNIANNLKPGWGKEKGAGIGPIMTLKDQRRILDIIDDAVEKGARLICGGKKPSDRDKGYYLEPTVLADVTCDMRCYKEELFGPVMPVIKYNDQTDLIEAGNDTEYGLAAYIFSNNLRKIFHLSRGLKFGSICVNEPYYNFNLPHGGFNESGIGKDCSKYSLEEYYVIKRISLAF